MPMPIRHYPRRLNFFSLPVIDTFIASAANRTLMIYMGFLSPWAWNFQQGVGVVGVNDGMVVKLARQSCFPFSHSWP